MLHFKPITFKFRYKNGRECIFIGSCGLCAAKYKAEGEDVAEVYQLIKSRFTKISD